MFKHVLVMMLLAPSAFVLGATSDEATWSNGLEANNTTRLRVVIEVLSKEAKKIGLSQKRIEAGVNQSLRKAGITPVSAPPGTGDYLYVNVNVIASGSFAINISFHRQVFYRSGRKWFTTEASTWRRGGVGIAHGDADYILDGIARHVEVFCNEFLKANGK